MLRGDGPGISVGGKSNLQDGTVVQVAARGLRAPIGRNVTVGHLALLHACEIEEGVFIDTIATVLDGAVMESGAMVAAGTVVTSRRSPTRSYSPDTHVRALCSFTGQMHFSVAMAPENWIDCLK